MEKDLSFALLIIAGIILFSLILFSLKARYSQRYQQTPEVGDIDKLLSRDVDLFAKVADETPYLDAIEPIIPEANIVGFENKRPQPKPSVPPEASVAKKNQTKPVSSPKIIAINILPQSNEAFVGYGLLQSLLAANLRFGAMSIFHFHEKPHGEGKILFSLAQATEPGIFDMNNMGACVCKGLTLFMQFNELDDALTTFNLMLETAEQLAEDLNGIITDSKHHPLTEETLASICAELKIPHR